MFHLSPRLISFGGHSAHLAYLVHKSDHEISDTQKYLFTLLFTFILQVTHKLNGFRVEMLL